MKLWKNRSPRDTTLAVLVMLSALVLLSFPPALGNNAYLVAGGSAYRISSNDTVSMQSEVVKIHVGKHLARVDCRFVFVNNGPACTVRMGFPDQTNQPLTNPDRNLRGSFLSYRSFVDGKKVTTKVVLDDDTGTEFKVWHAKDVAFPANSTVVVQDSYVVRPGVVAVDDRTATKLVYYILHTASSWKGAVRRADVYVTFTKSALPGTPRFVRENKVQDKSNSEISEWWHNASDGTVLYSAPVSPKVDVRTLHFEMTDFRPTPEDNIALTYDRMNRLQATAYGTLTMGTHFLKQNLPTLFRRKE